MNLINRIGRLIYSDFKDEKVQEFIRVSDTEPEEIEEKNDDIFQHIYGHDTLKTVFNNAVSNVEPIHILLTGTPGAAKTLFLEAVGENVENACFITNNATGPGLLNLLYEKPELRFLCIDEIEKIPRDQLAVLLALMESGRLIVTKKTMSVNREQKVTIFATCNNKNRLAREMLSRFLKFHLKPYTLPEFNMVTKNLIIKKFNKSEEIAEKIATAVWQKMGSRDIRDCIKLAILTNKKEDMDIMIEAIQEYRD